jgi:hypothetical protein
MLPKSFQSQPKATAARSVTPKPERSATFLAREQRRVNQWRLQPNLHPANQSCRSKKHHLLRQKEKLQLLPLNHKLRLNRQQSNLFNRR